MAVGTDDRNKLICWKPFPLDMTKQRQNWPDKVQTGPGNGGKEPCKFKRELLILF